MTKRDTRIVFDLEITGLSRVNDRIIQIAAIRYGIGRDMIDMAWLESEAYRITGSANQTDFSKFRGDLSA